MPHAGIERAVGPVAGIIPTRLPNATPPPNALPAAAASAVGAAQTQGELSHDYHTRH
jgi:hypothetical protein